MTDPSAQSAPPAFPDGTVVEPTPFLADSAHLADSAPQAERRIRQRLHASQSLRRRIALIFVAAVIATTLFLALSAYFITSSTQWDNALDKALRQSRFNLFLADSLLPAQPGPADYQQFLQAMQIRGDFSTLIQTDGEPYVSGPQVDVGLITPELAASVAQQNLAYQTVRLAGEPALAVGGRIRPDLSLYFFYPQRDLVTDLNRLRDVLLIGGLAFALLGAIAGFLITRRLVAPITQASIAAEQMSHGDLNIRLQEGPDEFGVLAGSFNRMAENLQAKMDDLKAGQARERRFVADVAHELRTPVSALVGEASLLKTRMETDPGTVPPEIAHLAKLVSNDIGRLRQLVDDLLEVSRLDAKAADTVPEWVDAPGFVRRLVEAHGWSREVRVMEDGEAAYSGDTPGGYVLRTDKRRLERILVNLIENALRHGRAPVAVDVLRYSVYGSEHDSKPALGITVTDSGPGIALDHLPHIFDRFFKADPSRSSSRGSGLGLAIARENARLLGGDLMAANAPKGGARFLLTLPADG